MANSKRRAPAKKETREWTVETGHPVPRATGSVRFSGSVTDGRPFPRAEVFCEHLGDLGLLSMHPKSRFASVSLARERLGEAAAHVLAAEVLMASTERRWAVVCECRTVYVETVDGTEREALEADAVLRAAVERIWFQNPPVSD